MTLNSDGLNIYYKKSNEYYLKTKLKVSNDVEKVVEIKPLILFQKHFMERRCLNTFGADIFFISISTFDIEKEKETNLKDITIYDYFRNEEENINFLIKNNYLLIKYGKEIDIFNIDKNMELIKIKKENSYDELRQEIRYNFLCDYYGDLFFAKKNDYLVQIYKLEEEKISFFSDFPFDIKGIKRMCKFKNNMIVMYSEREIKALHYKK